jgi:hypothetical protein
VNGAPIAIWRTRRVPRQALVTVGQPPRPPGCRRRWGARLAATLGASSLLSVAGALLFFDFGVRVLASNDETRFPMLARHILASGHWLAPRLGDAL